MSWHVDTHALAGYAAGGLSDSDAASIDAHLIECAPCRDAVAGVADRARLDAVWTAVLDQVDRPRLTVGERLLRALRVGDDTARLLAATPSLRTSWLLGIAMTLAFAVVAGHRGAGDGSLFLLTAPVLPVAAVAAAYGPGVDPTHEVSAVTPYGGGSLLFLRVVAVLVVTMTFTALAALGLPHLGATSVAWLVPALALSLTSLAVASFVTPTAAASVTGTIWVVGILAAARMDLGRWRGLGDAIATSPVFDLAGQLAFLALAVAAGAVVLRRREAFAFRDVA